MSQVLSRAKTQHTGQRTVFFVPLVLLVAATGLVIANQLDADVVVAHAPDARFDDASRPAVSLDAPVVVSQAIDEVLAFVVDGERQREPGEGPAPSNGQSTAQSLASDAEIFTQIPIATAPPTPVPSTPEPEPISPTSVPALAEPGISAPTATSVPAPAPVAAAPTAPAVVLVPTVAPTQVPTIAGSPTAARSGPPAVISQIPNSAWRWLDANGWRVEWRQGPGPGRVSEAQYATSTIVIWYDTRRSDAIWAGAFAHELGHAVSYVHFSSQQMNEWNAMRGLSSWRWVPGTPTDFGVGEGDFAEAFMSYLLGHQVRSVGGPLTQAHRAWIAANTPF